MNRVPRTRTPSNVRRRLFPEDDVSTQAKVENSTNYLQESIERDIKEKIQKWNFDFENDVPLEGIYEWTPCIDGSTNWVGRKAIESLNNKKDEILAEGNEILAETDEILAETDEIFDKNIVSDKQIKTNDLLMTEDEVQDVEKVPSLSIKEINEITPRNYSVGDLPIRKRKNEIIDAKDLDKGVRRKISFD